MAGNTHRMEPPAFNRKERGRLDDGDSDGDGKKEIEGGKRVINA